MIFFKFPQMTDSQQLWNQCVNCDKDMGKILSSYIREKSHISMRGKKMMI
jgi:hypothetical protein